MVTIYEADTSIDAHLLRGLLEQRGIPVHIIGEALEGGVGELPAGGLVAVLVPEDCVDAAREVVDEFEDNLAEPGPDAPAETDPPEAPADVERLVAAEPRTQRPPTAGDWLVLAGFLAALTALAVLGEP